MSDSTPSIPDNAEASAADGVIAASSSSQVLQDALARGEALGERLSGYPGPAYKRAYLDGLLKSGMGFLRAGNGRSAAYCLDKVEAGLEAAMAAQPSHPAISESPMGAGPEAAMPDRRTPLHRLRTRWREERVLKAVSVLERHGRRLTSLERKAYRESLAKWSKPEAGVGSKSEAGAASKLLEAGPGESAARRADMALVELRRRLYWRILKSQKAGLVRRGGPIFVPVQAQFAGPIGPYNDRQNLEGVLNLLAQGDPAWVEEFLELYRGLAGLKAMLPAGTANKA